MKTPPGHPRIARRRSLFAGVDGGCPHMAVPLMSTSEVDRVGRGERVQELAQMRLGRFQEQVKVIRHQGRQGEPYGTLFHPFPRAIHKT